MVRRIKISNQETKLILDAIKHSTRKNCDIAESMGLRADNS